MNPIRRIDDDESEDSGVTNYFNTCSVLPPPQTFNLSIKSQLKKGKQIQIYSYIDGVVNKTIIDSSFFC